MITVQDLEAIHSQLCKEALELVSKKGHDYSGGDKDTLRNIRMARKMGLVDKDSTSVLVRLIDKINRMCSLNSADPAVKEESIRDTVRDVINYSIYWLALKEEEKKAGDDYPFINSTY